VNIVKYELALLFIRDT